MLVEQQTCPLETLMPENGHFPFKLWSQREIVILFRKRSSLFPKEPPLLLLGCLLSISHPISYIKHRATLAYILVWYTTIATGFFIAFVTKRKTNLSYMSWPTIASKREFFTFFWWVAYSENFVAWPNTNQVIQTLLAF